MDDHTVTGRLLEILDVVADLGPVPLAKLAAETGIPKPTVRRIAENLVLHRMLTRGPDGYRLGLRLWELGTTATRHATVAEVASPYLQELSFRTRQIAWLGIVTEEALLVVDTAFTEDHTAVMSSVDTTAWLPRMATGAFPSTAAGQLMLAMQPEIVEKVLRAGPARVTPYTVINPRMILQRLRRANETGIATEHEELRVGWWCAAMVVRGPSATHIIGLTAEVHGLHTTKGLLQLQRTANRLQTEIA
jgi:DNA-binding IclR family transcriptional regulator